MKNYFVHGFVIVATMACTRQQSNTALFTSIPASSSGLVFSNDVKNTRELNIFNYRNFYNGGGVGIGDINNDGLPDVFMTGNAVENKMFLNKGDFVFEEITGKAGLNRKGKWSTGVVMVDINGDGWLDIYLCNAGYIAGDNQQNELYINHHDLTFTEEAEVYGLNNNGYTTHAAFFDYDLDGDLDAYILNNSFIPVNTLNMSDRRDLAANDWPVKDFLKKGGDQFLRNDNGHFTDITHEAGIYNSLIGFGLGVTVGDVNQDRWPDIYVSNDFYERDYLYINKGDGTFTEDIMNRTDHISLSSMGADMADLNNDGNPEIFVTDMLPEDDYRLRSTTSFENYSLNIIKRQRNFHHQFIQNTVQYNRGDGSFGEIAHYAGVSATDWSWGALLMDMDLDGWKDIYVCNGIQHDVTDQDFIDFFADDIIQKMVLTGKKEEVENVLKKMPSTPLLNKIFRNKGDLKFEDVSASWAPNVPSYSNGAAYGDLDNDGDLDLVINNVNQEAFLYKNNARQSGKKHFIAVKLEGVAPNTFAIGSVIHVYSKQKIFTSEIMPSRGFQSSVDYKQIIGIGEVMTIDSLEIQWPGFGRTVLISPGIDTLIVLKQNASIQKNGDDKPMTENQLLHEEINPFLPHVEDGLVDFYEEGLLMHKLSVEGPAYVRGDINGDHIDDFIIGGAADQVTMVYLGTSAGWSLEKNTGLENEANFEDIVAVLADLDMDGDNDLIIGSGGNHDLPESRTMQDRVYLNDSKGHFRLSPNALPPNGYNTSSIAIDDIDLDGDPDLLICSRSIPGDYGPSPPSYVYQNDGHALFKIVTTEIAPEFQFAGLLTKIIVVNILGDSRPEWIITREWGAPLIFGYQQGKYVSLKTNLSDYPGWWFTVNAADLDNDGDQDLILGNRGENFYMSGQTADHYKLWLNDFDKNGTVENIITRTINGKDIPVPMKKDLTEQLPFLKKSNLQYRTYANNTIQDLLPAEKLSATLVLNSSFHSSIVAWNTGNGDFDVERLPTEVQLSCIASIAIQDLNHDGRPDLILGGNYFGFAPQFSQLDASVGNILINHGKNKWEVLDYQKSGWRVKGEIKWIDLFSVRCKSYLLSVRNNDQPALFSFTQKEEF